MSSFSLKMKQAKGHITVSQSFLSGVSSNFDFFKLINFIYLLIFKELHSLDYGVFKRLMSSSSEELYTPFSIKKKSGKQRKIHAPEDTLKKVQYCLNEILRVYYEPNDNVCGFIPQRSIIYGASRHTNKQFVYNIDLKDFFDQIDINRVQASLRKLFKWNSPEYPLPYCFAKLCCCKKRVSVTNNRGCKVKIYRNVLPQGAPTSPTLTNIVCQEMDGQLAQLANKFDAVYTRYADDITFSCNTNIFGVNSEFSKELRRLVERDNHFIINKKKTRLQNQSYQQEVTGIVVNQKVNIRKRYVKQLRMWLYLWEHYGQDKAQRYFIADYLKDKGHIKNQHAKIENVIGGKLDYLKMVVGAESDMYKKLSAKYNNLIHPKKKNANPNTSNDAQAIAISDSDGQLEIPFVL